MHTHTHIPRSVYVNVYARRYILYYVLCVYSTYPVENSFPNLTDIPVFGTPILDINIYTRISNSIYTYIHTLGGTYIIYRCCRECRTYLCIYNMYKRVCLCDAHEAAASRYVYIYIYIIYLGTSRIHNLCRNEN